MSEKVQIDFQLSCYNPGFGTKKIAGPTHLNPIFSKAVSGVDIMREVTLYPLQ